MSSIFLRAAAPYFAGITRTRCPHPWPVLRRVGYNRPRHRKELGREIELCRLFASAAAPCGSRPSCLNAPRRPVHLNVVSLHDSLDQSREALFDLCAARGIPHFHSNTLSPDQPCFPEGLEVLREGRLRNFLFAHCQKVRTGLGTNRPDDISIDGCAYRIGERMKNSLDRNIFQRRMKQRPHVSNLTFLRLLVQ